MTGGVNSNGEYHFTDLFAGDYVLTMIKNITPFSGSYTHAGLVNPVMTPDGLSGAVLGIGSSDPSIMQIKDILLGIGDNTVHQDFGLKAGYCTTPFTLSAMGSDGVIAPTLASNAIISGQVTSSLAKVYLNGEVLLLTA